MSQNVREVLSSETRPWFLDSPILSDGGTRCYIERNCDRKSEKRREKGKTREGGTRWSSTRKLNQPEPHSEYHVRFSCHGNCNVPSSKFNRRIRHFLRTNFLSKKVWLVSEQCNFYSCFNFNKILSLTCKGVTEPFRKFPIYTIFAHSA